MAAVQQLDERRLQIENKLRRVSSKWNLGAALGIFGGGVFLVLAPVLFHDLTRADRMAAWILGFVAVLIGGGLLCWDMFQCRKLKKILSEMQPADIDLESAGPVNCAANPHVYSYWQLPWLG